MTREAPTAAGRAEVEEHDEDARRFLAAIVERYGYDLRGYAPQSMHRRLRAAVRKNGVATLEDLQRAVLADPQVFAHVLDQLTVQVTDMVREPILFHAVRATMAPVLRTYPILRFWVAGCATGEEAYTLAIVLHEEGLYERAQIYATDLSFRAIEEAKEGVYHARDPEGLRARYAASGGVGDPARHWTAAYDRIVVREHLRRNVFFFQHDLASDAVFGEMHAVFCRNVLIYFGPELQRRVCAKLTSCLVRGGFLAVARCERTAALETSAHLELTAPEVTLYRRKAGA